MFALSTDAGIVALTPAPRMKGLLAGAACVWLLAALLGRDGAAFVDVDRAVAVFGREGLDGRRDVVVVLDVDTSLLKLLLDPSLFSKVDGRS